MAFARLLFKAFSIYLAGHGLGRNRVVASLFFGIAKLLLPTFILYRGSKIYLKSENAINLAIFGYRNEEYELSLFESELVKKSVVLDIGANIGLYTLAAAKYADKVYSFEPDLVSFLNLKKNIEANSYKNVIAENRAVSNKTGQANFTVTSHKKARGSLHLISNDEKSNREHTRVETVAMDDFFRDKPPKVDIVKMDIEGSEYEALKGMKNLINTNKKMKLFLEFNPYALDRNGTDLVPFLDCLYYLFFKVYYIDETRKARKAVNKEWLLDFAKDKEIGRYANLLCLRDLK